MSRIGEVIGRLYNHEKFNWMAFGLIILCILAAYSNTFTASFHFDDNPAIIENSNIRHITVDNIIHILKASRPVVNLSIMLNYAVSGLNVVGWHAFNIAVHAANSCLVYILVLWTLRLPVFGGSYAINARRISLFAALLFGVHPIQTESVTYIISRTELLATFFYLLTFLFVIRLAQTGKYRFTVGAYLSAVLAIGSKEWAVTLPALLALYDFIFLSEGKVKPLLRRVLLYLLMFPLWYIVLRHIDLFAKGGVSGVGFNVATTSGLSSTSYFLTSLNVLWTYVRLLLLPINQNLDYDYPIAKVLFEFPTILSLIGHIAVVAVCFWLYVKKGWKLIPFGVAWFYISISPTQSIVPIVDVIFEHRVYMPSIGFFLAFVAAYEMVFSWWDERKASAVKSTTTSS